MAIPVAMHLLQAAILTIACQFLVGRLIVSGVAWLLAHPPFLRGGRWRRWLVVWTDASRTLRRATPYFLALGGAGLLLPWLLGNGLPTIRVNPGWFLLFGAGPTVGSYLLFGAARKEARGRLPAARRQARLGGELAFVGIFLQLVLVWTGLLFVVPFRRAMLVESAPSGVVLLVAMLCLGCSAFVAILAGLAGKPRPSVYFAAPLYLLGLVGLIAAAQLALG